MAVEAAISASGRSVIRAKRGRRTFLERSIGEFAEGLDRANRAETVSAAGGLLQHVSPKAKLVSILLLVCGVVGARYPSRIAIVLGLAVCVALASRIDFSFLVRFVWLGVFGLSGLIAIPALFLTAGAILYRVPLLGWPMTDHGLHIASLLILRTETTATLLVLLVLSTAWMEVLRSLRALRMPKVLVALVGMTYRYVFLLLAMAVELFDARRSRIVAPLTGAERRRLVATTAGVLFSKSAAMSEEVFQAMQARGYRGEVYLLEATPSRRFDWLAVAIACAGTAFLVWPRGLNAF